jgi:hypothetical protein
MMVKYGLKQKEVRIPVFSRINNIINISMNVTERLINL